MQARQTLGLRSAGWVTRASSTCAIPRAYVEVPAGTYPYGEKGGTVEIAGAVPNRPLSGDQRPVSEPS